MRLSRVLTIQDKRSPVGSIENFSAAQSEAEVPDGWLLCNGAELAISEYEALYEYLGTTYGTLTDGSGNAGSTHFRIPDLRGEFLRGGDNMGSPRGAANIDSGRALCSTQSTRMKVHSHGKGTLTGSTANYPHSHPQVALAPDPASHSHPSATRVNGTSGRTSPGPVPGYVGATNPIRLTASPYPKHKHTAPGGTSSVGIVHSHDFTGSAESHGGSENDSEIRPLNIAVSFIIKT